MFSTHIVRIAKSSELPLFVSTVTLLIQMHEYQETQNKCSNQSINENG